jgi:hypothetical protein
MNQKTRLLRRDRYSYRQLVLDFGRCNLTTLLIIRKHHGEAVPQGQVIPREVKPFAALVGPDCADARLGLLPVLVFAYIPTVVEDIRWCVRHGNVS